MSAHTPGPWRYVHANPSPTTGEHMIAGAKPGFLAEVRDCGSGDVGANARLIATSPRLLAALEALVKTLAFHDDEGLIVHAVEMVEARAAIAQARGTP